MHRHSSNLVAIAIVAVALHLATAAPTSAEETPKLKGLSLIHI